MILESRALKVLGQIEIAIRQRAFFEWLGQWKSKSFKTTVSLPEGEEIGWHVVASFFKIVDVLVRHLQCATNQWMHNMNGVV